MDYAPHVLLTIRMLRSVSRALRLMAMGLATLMSSICSLSALGETCLVISTPSNEEPSPSLMRGGSLVINVTFDPNVTAGQQAVIQQAVNEWQTIVTNAGVIRKPVSHRLQEWASPRVHPRHSEHDLQYRVWNSHWLHDHHRQRRDFCLVRGPDPTRRLRVRCGGQLHILSLHGGIGSAQCHET